MRRIFCVVTVAVLLASCAPAPMANSQESLEALARAVLQALERRDLPALEALALNREEFTEHVWPDLPSARPERNLSAGYVWGDLNQKSNLTLQQTVTAHGGRHYEFEAIRFLGDSTRYASYTVHRESELTVKDADGGGDRRIRLFGSVLEKDGRYKVFSYVIND